MRVWAVSSGDYSDYRVHAMFTSKKLAQEVADLHGGGVEEFELYDEMPKRWVVYRMGVVGHKVRVPGHTLSQTVWQKPYGNSRVEWPWQMECRTDGRPYIRKGPDFIHIAGVDKERVERAFDDFWGPIEAAEAGLT